MTKLLDKVRPLTLPERRKLASEGIYLLGLAPELQEKALYDVLAMVFSDKELEDLNGFKDEDKVFAEIIKVTYGLEDEDSKN